MKYLSQKEIVQIAQKQDKLTDDFRTILEKFYARYQLQIISEAELFSLLNLQK